MTEAAAPRGDEGNPILERETELLAIERALNGLCGASDDPSAARRGGVLAFAGPAGLGKTALVNQLRHRAARRGCTVLFARGGEYEKQVPFRVMRLLIQPMFAAMSQDQCRELLGTWYPIVAPALGLDAPTGAVDPDPQGVLEGLDWAVTRLAVRHDRPLAIVLDDAHWADGESLKWLTAFAARAEELGVLLVVASRPGELPVDATALRELTERHGTRPHELTPLTSGAVTDLARQTLGQDGDDLFCRELWAITAGNPFEVVELLQKSKERGLKAHEDSIPELRDLASAVKGSGLAERLNQFDTPTIQAAWAAAVLGSSGIPVDLIGPVSSIGDARAAEAIAELQDARILTVLTNIKGERVVEFNHPLIANAVYGSI